MVIIAPIVAPEEGLFYTSNKVDLKIGNKIIGNGTLYITSSVLAWQPDDIREGISIPWKQISVHGTCVQPRRCIYFVLDHMLLWFGVYERANDAAVANGNGNADGAMAVDQELGENAAAANVGEAAANADEEEDEGNASDEDDPPTECWLMPEDVNTVEAIYSAMTQCQALHRDSAESYSSESDFMDDDEADDDSNDGVGPGAHRHDGADAAQGAMRNLHINDDDDENFQDAE